MLRGAIFDFDGTLFDSMFVWDGSSIRYLRSIGIEPEPDTDEQVGRMSLLQTARYFREKYAIPQTVEEIMQGINRTVEDLYFYKVQPKDGVIEFLKELQARGVIMCIATATDRYQIEAALRRCDMDGFFSEIFTCSEVGHGKDEPIIFRRAREHMGTPKAATVVFEDAAHAAQTAKADGFPVAAVYDPSEAQQEELRAAADSFIESFNDTNEFRKFAYGL